MMHLLRTFLVSALLLACCALQTAAQTPAVSLFADSIRYQTTTREIVAIGNVEAFYQGYRLSATEIRYDADAGTIRAEGPIRLESPDEAVILASLAELSADFREGLIRGARLILDDQFQIAAVEGQRNAGRYNTLYKTVASSCSVCADDPTPIWRIRAQKVVHDAERQRLYFQNAWLDVFGIPILYLPRLRMPEPGVRRAAGVLVPSFSNSDVYGFGFKLPYFIPRGDHADLLLTPFVTTTGAGIIEAEYRRRFRSGALRVSGAFALRDGLGDGNRGFVDADGVFALPRGFEAAFSINNATDRSFLGQFNYSDADRLESTVAVSRVRATDSVTLRAEGYQTLREDEAQGNIPLLLPGVTYRRYWPQGPAGGKLGLEAGLLNLTRQDGRDVLRLNLAADWRGDARFANGIVAAGIATMAGEAYRVNDDPTFPDALLVRGTPTIGAELRWPLSRSAGRAVHVIEPVAQLLYSDTLGDENVPNEDSLLPELDETNLFSLNRFPGVDGRETGLRLNTGISYTRYDPSGWNLGATVGRVFRREATEAFTEGTGLGGESSDYVAAVSLELPSRLSATGRARFDPGLDFRRADLEVEYLSDRFDLSTSYIYLAADDTSPILGALEERQEIAIDGRYLVRPNWQIEGEWRYNIAADRPIFARGGLIFGNECIEAGLSLSRRFTSSNNVPRSTEISLEIALAGVGTRHSGDWPTTRCRGI